MAAALPDPIDHEVPAALVGSGPRNPDQYPPANIWGPFVVDINAGEAKLIGAAMRFDWSAPGGGEQVTFYPADEALGRRVWNLKEPPVVAGDTLSFDTDEFGAVEVRPLTAADVPDASSDADARRQAATLFGLR